MQWLLLNQHYASTFLDSRLISVLEEVISSELQLVQVLVSGRISSKTMNLVGLGQLFNNLESGVVQ